MQLIFENFAGALWPNFTGHLVKYGSFLSKNRCQNTVLITVFRKFRQKFLSAGTENTSYGEMFENWPLSGAVEQCIVMLDGDFTFQRSYLRSTISPEVVIDTIWPKLTLEMINFSFRSDKNDFKKENLEWIGTPD